ncbi:hypothetical protein [Sphingomonas sp.]|uniref:hypothetical protein n=1 Tax=Sphingomonas sp. TaxID=28214 RepID=UPI003AFF8734
MSPITSASDFDDLRAEAQAIVRAHGDAATRWVAEQTVASNLAGHLEGVHRYRRIAALLDEMRPVAEQETPE